MRKKTYDGIHEYNTEAALDDTNTVCPVCRKAYVETFCCCPICGWYMEIVFTPDEDEGLNYISLNEAKRRYRRRLSELH